MAAVLNIVRYNVGRPCIYIFNYLQSTRAASSTKIVSCANPVKWFGINAHWTSIRSSHTFLGRTNADQLWKGVTSVSAAGRKKGRARGLRKRIRDLNKGQVIGFGDKNMLWPGLNSPIIRGHEVVQQQELPPDETRKQRLYELRDKIVSSRVMKLTPLERGWNGTKLPGRSFGPPDPVGDETFEGFDSRVLQFKSIFKMTGVRGRVKSMRAFVVVGNKNGLGGYALAKSPNGMTAVKNARNKAAQALRCFPREDNRTVIHDFVTTFGAVTIYVFKKPEGHGLVCHRVIRTICETVGIKDLFAKCEGAIGNEQNIAKAFFMGLMRQKTLQDFANEKQLHVVELRAECDNYPRVVASPPRCRTEEEIDPYENLDFRIHMHGGRVLQPWKKFEPFYINFPCHIKREYWRAQFRNHRDVKIQLAVRHGKITSFLHLREEEKEKKAALEAMENS